MDAALSQLSKPQLIDKVRELSQVAALVPELQEQLAWFKRQMFGQKRERSIPTDPEQLLLELGLAFGNEPEAEEEEEEEEINYKRRKRKKRKEKPSRQLLPDHLERRTEIITPDGDLSGAVKIGEEITEILEFTKPAFWVRRIVREKYAWPGEEEKGVAVAPLPSRPLDKAIAGATLLAQIIINKYVDHLPLYRQIQRFRRLGVTFPKSTMCGWTAMTAELLAPLYMVLVKVVLESGYVQSDDTSTRVQCGDKKGKTHLGHHWIYQSPELGLVIFEYQKGKSRAGPETMLKGFSGFLQTDGNPVYDTYETGSYPQVQVVGCMAHARRKFFDAKDNDPRRSEEALCFFRELYKIEREAREKELTPQQRHDLRQERAIPVLNKLKTWLNQNIDSPTPKSSIGKAIGYSLKRWKKLCNYTLNGRLEIDNNLAENSIRPIALGRKNYLFAGSHETAQHAAMFYSFLASCKRNQIDPHEWLLDILNRIKEHPVNRLRELLPDQWQPLQKNTPC